MKLTAKFSQYINQKEFNFYLINGAKFNIPNDKLNKFYEHVEGCLKEEPLNLFEYYKGEKGVWVDIDAISDNDKNILNKYFKKLSKKLAESIWTNITNEPPEIEVLILAKNPRPYNGAYKHSVHLRVPKIRVPKIILKDILSTFSSDTKDLFETLFPGQNPVDMAVVKNHPLVYGCVKIEGGEPHRLAMKYVVSKDNIYCSTDYDNIPIGRYVSLYNNPNSVVFQEDYINDEPEDDLIELEHKFGTNFKFMHTVIGAINGDYGEYKNWKHIIWALSISCVDFEMYMALANHFTKTHIDELKASKIISMAFKSSAPKDLSQDKILNQLMTDIYNKGGTKNLNNFGIILNILRQQDKQLYNSLVEESLSARLMDSLMTSKVEVLDLIELITLFVNRYIAIERGWYEYVSPYEYDNNSNFYLKTAKCKYVFYGAQPPTLTNTINEISTLISEKITSITLSINKKDKSGENTDNLKNLLIRIKENAKLLKRNIIDSRLYKNLHAKLIRVEIESLLDTNPKFIGVLNGILEVGEKFILHTSCEQFYISRSTNANYVPYDPDNRYVNRMEGILREIYKDSQALFSFMMKVFASSLDGRIHDIFIMICSKGNSGKSTLMRLLMNTLGNTASGGYSYSLPDKFLNISKNSGGDSPSATMKDLNGARIIWQNELEPNLPLNTTLIKNLWDKPTIRGLFELNNTPSNISGALISHKNVESTESIYDSGYWRRLAYIKINNSFTIKTEDTSIRTLCDGNDDESQAYRDALFSILTKYYREYYQEVVVPNKSLRAIIPMEIIQTTISYRVSHDPIYNFVNSRIKPEEGSSITMDDMKSAFRVWCSQHPGRPRYVDGIMEVLVDRAKENFDWKDDILQNYKIL